MSNVSNMNDIKKVLKEILADASGRKNELVEFKLLCMSNFEIAKEHFQSCWNKKTPEEKMDILFIVDSKGVDLSEVLKLEVQEKLILAELLMIRLKYPNYLPL